MIAASEQDVKKYSAGCCVKTAAALGQVVRVDGMRESRALPFTISTGLTISHAPPTNRPNAEPWDSAGCSGFVGSGVIGKWS